VAPIRYEEAKEPEKFGLEPKGMYIQDGPQSGTRAEFVVSTKADDAEAFTEMQFEGHVSEDGKRMSLEVCSSTYAKIMEKPGAPPVEITLI
jgi:uncharacterized protein with NRDE domain